MLAAVKQKGLSLEYASEQLKDNESIVYAALMESESDDVGEVSGFASESLQENKHFKEFKKLISSSATGLTQVYKSLIQDLKSNDSTPGEEERLQHSIL